MNMLFSATDFDNSPDLPRLIERLGPGGGSIIVYRQVYSIILFTFTRTVFEAVPHGRSAVLAGVKHALVSLILGPWSWSGPFVTLHAVLTNLSGGTDVTDLFIANAGSGLLPAETLREDADRKEKLVQLAFVAVLLTVLGIVIWKIVIPLYESAGP